MASQNFNGSGSALPLTGFTRQELQDALNTLQFKSGTACYALDNLTSQTGLVKQTNGTAGAKAMTTVASVSIGQDLVGLTTAAELRDYLEDEETIAGTPFTIDVTKATTYLTHTANATGTLPAGTTVGQVKTIILKTDSPTNTITIAYTGNNGYTTINLGAYMGAYASSFVAKWTGNDWEQVGGQGVPS
jgi:hypothetical protein